MVKTGHLVVALVLVRVLSAQDWASMALFLSIYIAAVGFGTLNIHHSIFFFYGRVDADGRRSLALQTAGLLAMSGLMTAAVVLAVSPLLGDGTFAIGDMLTWLAAALVFEIPTLGTSQVLIAAERPGRAAAYDASMATLQLGALCIPPAAGFGLIVAAQALFAYACVRAVVSLAVVLRLFPGRFDLDWRFIREQVVYSLPLALAIGTSVLNRSIDKWFVAGFDPLHFGAYAIAAQEVPLISLVPYAVGAVLATRMVHAFKVHDTARVLAYWMAQTSRMALIVVPAAIGLILCAEPIVALLFTEAYVIATLPFQIYTVILLHRVAEYGLVLRAAGDTRSLWWASAVLLGSNVVLSLPLTIALGMIGAAIGTLLANVVAWLYVLRRIARAMDTTIAAVFPWALMLRLLAASIAAAVVAERGIALVLGGGGSLHPFTLLVLRAAVYAALAFAIVRAARLRRQVPPVPAESDAFLHDMAR